ncbi:hypothetical protein [Enterococcus pallens]|uniref:Uncharacterized protein n=1 Tax=Enterococcus pallens ATCC BAA-351 TaxID=1158607 RepID=R2T3I0_9ENTE|nr:hypothetical protein [Enterococcus pallens]EOH94804.1 hypothetical protein UAU_01726 [Enterococcus pallens ATCC BAA-351]EOU14877.1 hypothetical protein I588_04527 [Enterococcus pallens ATCC BAA-351]OJG78137.1 hypothetical protein RV10_GL001625 [Enterococcus pallens]
MKFKNDEAEKGWQTFVTNNQDPYGNGVVKYCERWASLMEEKIANGLSVAVAADKTQYEADKEGITGFMYGCAVNTLSHCWAHGDALKDWHNGKYSYGGKGVVNPAIFTVGSEGD